MLTFAETGPQRIIAFSMEAKTFPILRCALFLPVLLFVTGFIEAKETFDVTSFDPPAGWKKETKEGVLIFSKTSVTGSFCIIGVYQSKESSGDLKTDFENDWQEVIVKPFEVEDPPQMEPVQQVGDWRMLAGGSSFTNDTGTSAVLLTTATGHSRMASIFVIVNDQNFMPAIETFLTSVQFSAPAEPPSAGTDEIAGTWTKSASSPWGISAGEVATNAGYYKSRYQFREDGTYSFKGESWGGYSRSDDWRTIEENGKYVIQGNSLSIIPSSSTLTLRDANGNIRGTQQNALETVTYKWQLHFFEGIGETNLILQPPQQTLRDGAFSGNSSFPNSYLYAQKDNLEWRY